MAALPDYIVGRIIVTDYLGGKSSDAGAKGKNFIRRVGPPGDDLQSAGLDEHQLVAAPPGFKKPESPTAAELRKLAIYNDYHGLIDTSDQGGFGFLFGPQRNGRVMGREYLAFARPPEGGALVTVMAQIPEKFDTRHPMIVTAPSSGSRGIYGAISVAEWAFLNGCAIAYTDKGTAPGFHELDTDGVYGVDGLRLPVGSQEVPVFRAPASPDLDVFKRTLPHRLAIKHAHCESNIEASWGQYVLLSIRFCLFCLNDWLGEQDDSFSRPTTKVIAAGVSNGGGAALRAAEQDTAGLIDAVVVSEPQVQPTPKDFVIRSNGSDFAGHSRSFLDYVTLMDVYAPCAALAIDGSDPGSADQQRRARRGAELAARGLLKETTTSGQAREALAIIHANGILPEADFLLPVHDAWGFWPLLATVFANAYARARVSDHLCGVSIAPVDAYGAVRTMSGPMRAQLAARSNGLLYFASADEKTVLLDDQGGGDRSVGAALAFRSLVTGITYPRQNAIAAQWVDAGRMAAGINAVRASGNLNGRPAIVVQGRRDALLPPNHTSRAYFGLNKTVEPGNSRLSYIEVVNGNHFDAFIPIWAPNRLVPVHYYFEQALTLMRQHLVSGGTAPLPPSQVVTATADHKPWNTPKNWKQDLPNIDMDPPTGKRITFADKRVGIPTG
jgi:hydroxybutyrate-dimer hydrolase